MTPLLEEPILSEINQGSMDESTSEQILQEENTSSAPNQGKG